MDHVNIGLLVKLSVKEMLHILTRVFVQDIQKGSRLQVGHVHEGDKEHTDDVQV